MLAIENNGEKFSEKKLLESQKLLAKCVQQIAQEIGPGRTEHEASEITKEALKQNGFGKNWHPPKIRFGPNTIKTYSETSAPDVVLQKNDIFFLDLGPILLDHECDYGETFVVGDNAALIKLSNSSKILFQKVKTKWATEKLSGEALYQYAQAEAKTMGYEFITKGASGHRVGDFPHQVHYKGNLIGVTESVSANKWILEIQIHDRGLNRGAFFEDIL
ncbi:MAG: aminopeptidase P family protein [Bdellovibrionaceae bacterium]|nr:aminopeptidase P family protein [Pseudobdellovibrionaceae bacterium]